MNPSSKTTRSILLALQLLTLTCLIVSGSAAFGGVDIQQRCRRRRRSCNRECRVVQSYSSFAPIPTTSTFRLSSPFISSSSSSKTSSSSCSTTTSTVALNLFWFGNRDGGDNKNKRGDRKQKGKSSSGSNSSSSGSNSSSSGDNLGSGVSRVMDSMESFKKCQQVGTLTASLVQDLADNTLVEGSAADGRVRVVMDGQQRPKRIKIDEQYFFSGDNDGKKVDVDDLSTALVTALQEAYDKSREKQEEKMKDLYAELGLPASSSS